MAMGNFKTPRYVLWQSTESKANPYMWSSLHSTIRGHKKDGVIILSNKKNPNIIFWLLVILFWNDFAFLDLKSHICRHEEQRCLSPNLELLVLKASKPKHTTIHKATLIYTAIEQYSSAFSSQFWGAWTHLQGHRRFSSGCITWP